jgi:linoleoyl-CoA desaturase
LRAVALTFAASTVFRRDLEARVDAYFEATGLARRGGARMVLKTVTILTWMTASYLALVFLAQTWWQALLLATSLALAMAGVGFCVMHDGNHGAYSRHRWVNKAAALSLNLLGGCAYFWHFKHNIAHHTYTNITGSDDDFNVGPAGRLSPRDRHRAFHRFQHLYIWGLYAMLALQWQTSGDFRSMIRPGVATTHVARPRGWEQVFFWVGKAVFYTLAFVVPLTRHGVFAVVAVYFYGAVVLGLTLSTVFQLAHCVQEASFPWPGEGTQKVEREWSAHQVETTVDFARGNALLTWYLGGLNFQIEHHLFPKICHLHYPALSPIVEDICRAHGVRHFAHANLRDAVRSHVRFLKRLGSGAPDGHADPRPAEPALAPASSRP